MSCPIPPRPRRRILAFLRERVAVADDPHQLAKALSGRFAGLWRLRVGDYRLIADIQNGCLRVLVLDIGHRRERVPLNPLHPGPTPTAPAPSPTGAPSPRPVLGLGKRPKPAE